jgi:hypothetical protein
MTIEQLIPEAKKLINEKIMNAFKEQGAKVAFTKIYTLLPVAIRLFVKEEDFVNFCIHHQDKLFGNQNSVKKTATKKNAVKKNAVKKAKPKKDIVKNASNKKKQS